MKKRTKLFLSSSMLSTLAISAAVPVSVAIQKNNTTNNEILETFSSTSTSTKQKVFKEIKCEDIDSSLTSKTNTDSIDTLKELSKNIISLISSTVVPGAKDVVIDFDTLLTIKSDVFVHFTYELNGYLCGDDLRIFGFKTNSNIRGTYNLKPEINIDYTSLSEFSIPPYFNNLDDAQKQSVIKNVFSNNLTLFVNTIGNVESYTYEEIASQILITSPLFIEPYGYINDNNQLFFPITINVDGAPSPITVSINKILFNAVSSNFTSNMLGGFLIVIGILFAPIVLFFYFLHENKVNKNREEK